MNAFRKQTPVTQNWLPATTLKEALNAAVIVALREMVLKGTAVVYLTLPLHIMHSTNKIDITDLLQISMSV